MKNPAQTQGFHVLAAVEKHLLTPMGLRNLSPEHPDYIRAIQEAP